MLDFRKMLGPNFGDIEGIPLLSLLLWMPQMVFNYSKSPMETPEQCVRFIQS